MKSKNILSKVKTAGVSLSAIATTMMMAAPMAFAEWEVDPETVVGGLVGYIWTIFRWIGVLLLAWSIGMLVLAFKNEDADSKSRSMMLLVVSILLMSVGTIFNELDLGL